MKKLALASVALAAVSAFGAGDAFGTTFVSSLAALGSNDTANWTSNHGAATLGTVAPIGPSLYSATTSIVSTKGVHVAGTYLSSSGSAALYYGNQNVTPSNLKVNFGFPNAMPILYGSTSGTLKISLSAAVKGLGFYVSPAAGSPGTQYYATVEFLGDTSHGGTHVSLGTDSVLSHISTGCSVTACTFVGLSTAANPNIIGITSAVIELGAGRGSSGYSPAISSVYLTESSKSGVPEPASLSILGVGLLGLGALRMRRQAAVPDSGWRWSPFGRWRISNKPPDKLQT